MADISTFGETMLRLSPPDDERLEAATGFDIHVGGSESNVAVAGARLGRQCTWVSKVPDSPLGRRVTGELRRHGVDPAVSWADDGRQGTYYLESGEQPRGTDVVYDRTGASIRTAKPAELPTARIESSTVFHTSGITPALSDRLAETTAELLDIASAAGTITSFDLNYRSKLWEPGTAGDTVTPMLEAVDLLFVPERDAGPVLGAEGGAEAIGRSLAERHDIETVVVTRGGDGSVAVSGETTVEQSVYPSSDAYPVGTGDAFVGGFLSQYVTDASIQTALQWGSATAALKRSIPGDVALVTRPEVEAVIGEETTAIDR